MLIAALAPAIAVFAVNKEIDAHREALASALSQKIGRAVNLDGGMRFGLSWHRGFYLGVDDVRIANPVWASRPLLASVGRMEFGLALPPLMHRRIEVTDFTLKNADVLLETSAAGTHNFDFLADALTTTGKGKQGQDVSLNPTAALRLENAHVAWRKPEGAVTKIDVDEMTMTPSEKELSASMVGIYAGKLVALDFKGKDAGNYRAEPMRFSAAVVYGDEKARVRGTLAVNAKEIDIDAFALSTTKSDIVGAFKINYGGTRTQVVGGLKGRRFDISDVLFMQDEQENAGIVPARRQAFSFRFYDLDWLKKVDARLDVAFGEVTAGYLPLTRFVAKLDMSDGRMMLSPVKTGLAGGTAQGLLRFDVTASSPQLNLYARASKVDLAQIIKLWGVQSFLVGQSDFDFDLATAGHSPHEMASNLRGQINLSMINKTTMHYAGLLQMVGGAMDLVVPGSSLVSRASVNCGMAQMTVDHGVLVTKKVLLDTVPATFYVIGNVNLNSEVVNLRMLTKPHVESASGIVPPMQVGGTLLDPGFHSEGGASLGQLADNILESFSEDSNSDTSTGSASICASVPSQTAQNMMPSAVETAGNMMGGWFGKLQGFFGNTFGDLGSMAVSFLGE